ncbi:anaphase-promoting complex subunit 10 [Arthroderma uncinatum]|uniref:anaphase-promoting complex subunit 10 n=1 Tax=Arthroderma uncinatum TaxID=74035 RepID=UPI00144AA532|nr:anaphase-promoting complex subunit 10 [Arthroderma uncinatum]KAF3481119.1 anaphase-promoting complex subunit 10 [Arthroderma uncinatum]
MPRQSPHRTPSAAFQSGDGASMSTARVPQLLPSYTPRQRSQGQQQVTPGQEQSSDREDELDDEDEEQDDEEEGEGDEEDEDEDEDDGDRAEDLDAVEGHSYEDDDLEDEKDSSAPIPPNLREISSLASWTVSTYKPGSGVAALRNPSPNQFWQSDGPQPHTLALHFFKRVAIVRIRVYLDFELDESYTPTKMIFLAGMGGNDLVEFATWQGDTPCGWVDIKLDGVGGRHQKIDKLTRRDEERQRRRRSRTPESRAKPVNKNQPKQPNVMVLQVKVCENHQNGKDTHVRGFQVFARDDKYYTRMGRADNGQKLLHHDLGVGMLHSDDGELEGENVSRFDEDDWMMEPELR